MELWEHQKQVARLLRAGKNVILQAPTGAGKTLAALWPYFEAWDRSRPEIFPRKCIYAVPMRVLANQFVDEARRIVEEDLLLAELPRTAIQTGERAGDREFTADLTFATIDQVLSSFLHMPYSLPRKLANLNAGAIVASYLVFDEFHLFDPVSTLPTTLEMLRMLRHVAPFVLMTATFSSGMLRGLAQWLGAEVVPRDECERHKMLNLPVERSKQRFYHWSDEPMHPDAILAKHRHRTLVVCNTVGRAQTLFRQLRDHPDRGGAEVVLLHSRFLPEHRAAKEQRVRQLFGKKADRQSGSVIGVATQVIEVGLDISAEVLHTEVAPANAVLQRAGRCARFKKECGDVYIYPVENSLPYRGQEAVIELTSEWLQGHDGERLDFIKEQALVDYAHGKFDREMLDGVMATSSQHRARMESALNGDRAAAGELVRKIVSQPMTISAEPNRLLARPFAAPLFSLHPGSLQGAAKAWLEDEDRELECDECVWRLEEIAEWEQGADEVRYCWRAVNDKSLLWGTPLIAVHPSLADYSEDEGLVLGRGGNFRAEDWLPVDDADSTEKTGWVSFYRLESYYDHIRLVYEAFRGASWPELAWTARRLEQRAGWPLGSVAKAAALVILLHDVGKLAVDWQAWAANWQEQLGRPIPSGFLVAHTDFDGSNEAHQQLQKRMRRRPPHAVEGGVASAVLLATAFRHEVGLLKAAFSAIARHHGAFSENFRRYRLHRDAVSAVRQTLSLTNKHVSGLDPTQMRLQDDPDRTPIGALLVDASDSNELLAYMLLARALRRADQLGTAAGTTAS